MKKHPLTVKEYIAGFPPDIKKLLKTMRTTIRKAAPGAEEVIKYHIPTYMLNGILVSFAAWKSYLSFYPAPRKVEGFKEQLAPYKGSKSTARFPFDKPLPLTLITRMVKYNVKRNLSPVK